MCLENTHNRGGGKVHAFEEVEAISKWARKHGLAMHLDGARLMNAVVASGISAAQWGDVVRHGVDLFFEGAGSAVGSAVAGPADLIKREGHRLRKVLGGGMRQAGVIAAGALHAS